MGDRPTQRRLAAVLAADVAGYSRLMHEDEAATIAAWHAARSGVIDPEVAAFGGRIVKHTGDGFLAEFTTATDAVECAVKIQDEFHSKNRDQPVDRRMDFRIGINLGEITADDEDIHGDGVNIAARLEGLAEAGGICVSATVHDQVHRKVSRKFASMGERQVKNISEPISCYRVVLREDDTAASVLSPTIPNPVRSSHRRRFVVWGGLLVIAIFLAVAFWQAVPSSEPDPLEPPSLAVVPFRSLDGDRVQKAFSDGLTQDVITALLTTSSIRVIAGSVTAREASNASPRGGQRSKARYLFEGSVRGGEKVRITAQLIDTRSGFLLWGGQYDRALSDGLSQQAEVSAKIVATLADKLDRIQRQQKTEAAGMGFSDFAMGALRVIGRMTNEAIDMPGKLFGAASGGATN